MLRKPNPTFPEGLKTSLKWRSDRISKEGAFLSVEDNIISSLKVNNEEHIKLLDLAAGSRGLKLTEFAIGVNEAVALSIDYKINLQMNEECAPSNCSRLGGTLTTAPSTWGLPVTAPSSPSSRT